jgi:predicted permease
MFGQGAANREFDAEVEEHVRLLTERYVQRGMSRVDAARAARRQFGNRELAKQRQREGRVVLWMANLGRDVRYAARQLWANPAFTVVMVLTLGLSIGANSAIFSVIDSVLLKSLPFPEPDRIVRVFLSSDAFPQFALNPFDLRDYRERSKSFEGIAGYYRRDAQLAAAGSGDAVRLNGFMVTAGYFRVLGLKPELGREIDPGAELPGGAKEVVVSDRLWRERFGASPGALGQKLVLDGEPYTVVGVMPPGTAHPGNGYHVLVYGETVDVWRPFVFEGDPGQRGSHFVDGIARLKAGVSAAQAQDELNAVMTQMAHEYPGDNGWRVLVSPLYKEVVGASRQMLLVLLGAVGMVLLIACANAANLLLARAASRKREIAVRLALGASRGRLVRQLLTESLLVSLLGGALGVALAVGGVRALVTLLPADFPRVHEIQVSVPVFVFTLGVSVVTGVLFGLAPALAASRTDPKTGLQQGSRNATGGRERARLRNALVISEVSMACVLLIGAGLLLRSLFNLTHLDPGFAHERVFTASLALPRAQYGRDEAVVGFVRQLEPALNAIPGVESAGLGSDLPWTGYDENSGFTVEGKQSPPGDGFHARYHMATPNYFRAIGMPLLKGRFFRDGDDEKGPQVLIVNQAMAQKFWPGEEAPGRRITFRSAPKDKDWLTVVGVVGDVKDKPNSPAAAPAFWFSEYQSGEEELSVVVRSNANGQFVADAVRGAVRRLDPALAVANAEWMDQIVERSVATPRITFVLVGLFAGLAMMLAAIGTYGVIAYSVSQRTAEFGLRMALGAQRGDVLGLVLRQAARMVLAGAALGGVLALVLGRVLKSLIYGVSAADPATFAVVGLMVLAVAAVACYIPALRATKADPMMALRSE